MMEDNTRSSHSKENQPQEGSTFGNKGKIPAENNGGTSLFINHATAAWHESRRTWVGDKPQKSRKMPKDPIISWSMTYEDLLSTHDPFLEPIPLLEMVDFLVDRWHDEGLYD